MAVGGSAGITVTLPSPYVGAKIGIKKIDSGAGAITVAAATNHTVDGSSTYSLSAQYDSVVVIFDGSAWNVENAGQLSSVTVTGNPSGSGQVLTSTSTTAAAWAALPNATAAQAGIIQLAGDLGNTNTAPRVESIQGVVITGTPSAGQRLYATSASAAAWSGSRARTKTAQTPLPSATAATYGTATTLAAPTGAVGLDLMAFTWNPNGVAGETITLQITATFDDSTTGTYTSAAITGNAGTQNVSLTALISGLFKNGHYATQYTFAVQSSIASSTATPSITPLALPVN